MVNLSSTLLQKNSLFGISMNDLKAWFRARKYVLDTFKLSELNADPIFIEILFTTFLHEVGLIILFT